MLDYQRLVSLDTILTLGDALAEKEQGKQPGGFVFHPLAGQTREFEMPRTVFHQRKKEPSGLPESTTTTIPTYEMRDRPGESPQISDGFALPD